MVVPRSDIVMSVTLVMSPLLWPWPPKSCTGCQARLSKLAEDGGGVNRSWEEDPNNIISDASMKVLSQLNRCILAVWLTVNCQFHSIQLYIILEKGRRDYPEYKVISPENDIKYVVQLHMTYSDPIMGFLRQEITDGLSLSASI